MTVASILKTKGSNVVTVQGGSRVIEAVRLLSEHRIGAAVVVSADKAVAGIFSERDLAKAVAEHGASALDRPVRDLMTTNVRSCRPSDSIEHVMAMMTEGRFRHLPVLEHGKLLGIVSIGDVVKRRIDAAEMDVEALRQYIAAS